MGKSQKKSENPQKMREVPKKGEIPKKRGNPTGVWSESQNQSKIPPKIRIKGQNSSSGMAKNPQKIKKKIPNFFFKISKRGKIPTKGDQTLGAPRSGAGTGKSPQKSE